MFGVVPKPLWERRIPADERNRIPLGMRCLLIEHASGSCSSTPARATRKTQKFNDIYGIENAGADGRTQLEDGLAEIGVAPEDVAIVINTHLHFDHAGGNTYRDESGRDRAVVSERALRRAARRVRLRDSHERAHGGELLPAQLRAGRRGRQFEFVDARAGDRAGHPRRSDARAHAASPERPDRVGRRARVLPRRPRARRTRTCRCRGSWATTSSRW